LNIPAEDPHLAAAAAALKSGRPADVIDHLTAAIAADPARAPPVYQALAVQLYRAGRHAEGETVAARGVARFPRDQELWNLRGVLLRQLKRYKEALDALETATRLDPRHEAPQVNRGNVLLDIGEYARGEAVFAKLVRAHPRNPEHQRQLGRALLGGGKRDAAATRFRQALMLDPGSIDARIDLAGVALEASPAEAQEILDEGLRRLPDQPRLLEAKVMAMRRSGNASAAAAYLEALAVRIGPQAWAHHQLGAILADYDRARANTHFRTAIELDPGRVDYLLSLIESLDRTRDGAEGAHIDEAYALASKALALGGSGPSFTKIIYDVLTRVCAYDESDDLGDLASLGRTWAKAGKHGALLKQLARVGSPEDRAEVLEQHRIWGRQAEALAAAHPIRRPARRTPGQRLRIGFMSSDLRNHPVAYFALPLFEHVDRSRFEIFAYSYYRGPEDETQAHIRQLCDAFRWEPEISTRAAAQLIADDDLDFLLELGASTHMNKLEVMAYRPAPLSGSWVGYPFSAGLKTIDYLLVDPYLAPQSQGLMLEKPLMLPKAWYALGSRAFRREPAVNPQPPCERNGFITFGTANNPYKYTPELIATWARVVAATAGSRFLFVRPEGGSAAFRDHVTALFERQGVGAERITFAAVRGHHLPLYNEMDISLDTFPQTGGTTTCESLWMGVPVISLVGPAMFERLSYSVLMNIGLEELCQETPESYVQAATDLAAKPERIAELRRTLRTRMMESPLGRSSQWASDFYHTIEAAVRGQPGPASSKPRA
jgi:protein O-GlcNAc transferase